MDAFYGIDIGTTNCKIAVCDKERQTVAVKSFKTPVKIHGNGTHVFGAYDEYDLYDAAKLWELVITGITELSKIYRPLSIGVASMAEAGVLIDGRTGTAMTDIIPWYDKRSVSYYKAFDSPRFNREGFFRTGLHNAYKYSVYKLLMLKDALGEDLKNAKWLSAAGYIAYRLTGCMGEDPTLTLRTYCFDIGSSSYDTDFINAMGLPETLFPPVFEAGRPVGVIHKEILDLLGLKEGVPVFVSGHDHLCAAVAAGALAENDVLLSLGTTAVIMGNFFKRPLTEADYSCGYSFGLHTLPGRMTWMGTLQSAGSAVDWARAITGIDEAGFEEMFGMLEDKQDVTGVLFFPYLTGSGAPLLDVSARGAFIGLSRDTDRAALIKSVLEGIAYEVRMILERAPSKSDVFTIRAAGGGSRNPYLMQILADVTGKEVVVSDCEQHTAAGAALIAAGCFLPAKSTNEKIYMPDQARSKLYTRIYENGYLRLQEPLRSYYRDEFERKLK